MGKHPTATQEHTKPALLAVGGLLALVAAALSAPALLLATAYQNGMLSAAGDCSSATSVSEVLSSGDARVEAYVRWAVATAADDAHGYDQTGPAPWPDRASYYTNPSQASFDCSSFVWFALESTGIRLGGPGAWPFTTQGMGGILKAHGFTEVASSAHAIDNLRRGDILVNTSTHTEIYVGAGQDVGAHSARPGVNGAPGDHDGREISVGPFSDEGWDQVWRLSGALPPTAAASGDPSSGKDFSAPSCPQGLGGDSPAAGTPVGEGSHADPGQAKGIAKSLMAAEYLWGPDQYQCLLSLWAQESGWRWDAENPASGAYGIPQALPGGKMASAGADWKTNARTQISWGLRYIAQRYQTPCVAKAHEDSQHWY